MMLRYRHLILLWASLLLLISAVTKSLAQQNNNNEDFVVGAYLPDYRFYININAAAPFLTDLILFSIEPNPDGSIDGTCCLSSLKYIKAREARQHKKDTTGGHLRLLVSVGGAGRSGGFSQLTSSLETMQNFVTELKSLCIREELDGIDMDWEQPMNQQEASGYMQLIQLAAAEFQRSNLVVTVALHPGQERYMLPKEVSYSVDRVHIMTYDMIKALGDNHASSEKTKEIALQFAARAPASKVTLGIPAYARHGQNPGSVKTYAELYDSLPPGRDLASLSTTQSNFDGYLMDSLSSVEAKVEFAKKEGLAGVFFWELGQDKQAEDVAPGGILLETAANASIDKASIDHGEEL